MEGKLQKRHLHPELLSHTLSRALFLFQILCEPSHESIRGSGLHDFPAMLSFPPDVCIPIADNICQHASAHYQERFPHSDTSPAPHHRASGSHSDSPLHHLAIPPGIIFHSGLLSADRLFPHLHGKRHHHRKGTGRISLTLLRSTTWPST